MKPTFTYLVAAVLGFLSLSSQAQNFNGVFKEVTSQADFTEGYYVIIKPFLASSRDTEIALCGVKKTEDNYRGDNEQIKIESNGEIRSPRSSSVWKVEQELGTFTIKHASTGAYMLVGKSNQFNVTTESSKATRLILSEYAKNYTNPRATAYTFRAEKKESWLVYYKTINPPTFVFTEKGKSEFKKNTAAPRFFKLVGFPFTMSSVQYATYYGDKTVKLPAGLTANVGEVDAQKHMLKLTPIGNVVPANTAVIITGSAGEYTLDVTTEAGSVPAKNDLKGAMAEIPAATVSSASFSYYAMAHNTQTNKVCFGLVETSIPAGKAYLEIPKTAGAAPELLGDFLISSVQHVQRDTDSSTIYDLNGRKVTQPVSGQLYVRNGKKFIYLR